MEVPGGEEEPYRGDGIEHLCGGPSRGPAGEAIHRGEHRKGRGCGGRRAARLPDRRRQGPACGDRLRDPRRLLGGWRDRAAAERPGPCGDRHHHPAGAGDGGDPDLAQSGVGCLYAGGRRGRAGAPTTGSWSPDRAGADADRRGAPCRPGRSCRDGSTWRPSRPCGACRRVRRRRTCRRRCPTCVPGSRGRRGRPCRHAFAGRRAGAERPRRGPAHGAAGTCRR